MTSGEDGQRTGQLQVSSQLWIYFAATIPLTALVVAFVLLWDRKRERKAKAEARHLELGVQAMEQNVVMKMVQQKTLKPVAPAGKDDDWDDFDE